MQVSATEAPTSRNPHTFRPRPVAVGLPALSPTVSPTEHLIYLEFANPLVCQVHRPLGDTTLTFMHVVLHVDEGFCLSSRTIALQA